MNAFGTITPSATISDLTFSTDDSEFTASVSFVDEVGEGISNLQIISTLGGKQGEVESKYQITARTDASGKASIRFNVGDIEQDGLVNRTLLQDLPVLPDFVFVKMFMNITNAESFDLSIPGDLLILETRARLSKSTLRVSPTILELTQGTTEAFSFTVTALAQDQDPIANARLDYTVLEAQEHIQNSVFTNVDGEATITLRDDDLLALSNLAVINNQNSEERVDTNATLVINFTSDNYPAKTITKEINILPNSLVITANPVQLSTRESTLLEATVPPIEIEVAVSDLFSRIVNAFVSIRWEDPGTNDFVDLSSEPERISPQTFTVRPKNLSAGEYVLNIIAQKDGITSIAQIDAVSGNSIQGLHMSQIDAEGVTVKRTIRIESSTITDVILTTISVIGGFILAKFGGQILQVILTALKFYKQCPHCEEDIRSNKEICPNCGRVTGFGDKNDPSVSQAQEIQEEPQK